MTLRQIKVMLVKNFLIAIAHKRVLIIDILLPLISVGLVYTVVRNADPTDIITKPNCFRDEFALPSAGPFHFARSLICGTFNLCYERKPGSEESITGAEVTPSDKLFHYFKSDRVDLMNKEVVQLLTNLFTNFDYGGFVTEADSYAREFLNHTSRCYFNVSFLCKDKCMDLLIKYLGPNVQTLLTRISTFLFRNILISYTTSNSWGKHLRLAICRQNKAFFDSDELRVAYCAIAPAKADQFVNEVFRTILYEDFKTEMRTCYAEAFNDDIMLKMETIWGYIEQMTETKRALETYLNPRIKMNHKPLDPMEMLCGQTFMPEKKSIAQLAGKSKSGKAKRQIGPSGGGGGGGVGGGGGGKGGKGGSGRDDYIHPNKEHCLFLNGAMWDFLTGVILVSGNDGDKLKDLAVAMNQTLRDISESLKSLEGLQHAIDNLGSGVQVDGLWTFIRLSITLSHAITTSPSPSSILLRNFVNDVGGLGQSSVKSTLSGIVNSLIDVGKCLDWVRFITVNDTDAFMRNETLSRMISAGLFLNFTDGAKGPQLHYQIRSLKNKIESPAIFRSNDFKEDPLSPAPVTLYEQGFVILQDLVDHAYLKLSTTPVTGNRFATLAQRMPSICWVFSLYQYLVETFMIMFYVCWVPPIVRILVNVVKEKEVKMKEFMKVMGLTEITYWVSWFITSLFLYFVPMIVVSFMLTLVFPNGSLAFFFIAEFSFLINIINKAFLLSIFFQSSKTCNMLAVIICIGLFHTSNYVLSYSEDMGFMLSFITCIFLHPYSMVYLLKLASQLDISTVGAKLSTLGVFPMHTSGMNLGQVLLAMYIDSILTFLGVYYLNSVFPGELGIPKPFYFPLTACLKRKSQSVDKTKARTKVGSEVQPVVNTTMKESNTANITNTTGNASVPTRPKLGIAANPMFHERPPDEARVGISVHDLVKKFKRGQPPAVNGLTVDFYYDQITALLGHNGAGKTTAMSIIAGMLRASSGEVHVDGNDVRTDMDNIRRDFSLCPQHDLLFEPLTIRQHMSFFGQLKGLSPEECDRECQRLTGDLNLVNKVDTPAKELSGGMKRLLSIGLAYVGSPKILILDEPSTGVDAHTRRSIWNLLQSYRAGRTTVISTHAMDEADVVSDRIAIMWKGQLCCSGSPMFLKKTFSKGYRLTIDFENLTPENKTETLGKATETIQKNYPEASLLIPPRVSNEATYLLPQFETHPENHPKLFNALEKGGKELGIRSYGLSSPGLEEVFNRVNEEAEIAADPSHVDEIGEFEMCPNFPPKLFFALFIHQVAGLLVKRFHNFRRSLKSFLFQIILPPLLFGVLGNVSRFGNWFDLRNITEVEMTPYNFLLSGRTVHDVFLANDKSLDWDPSHIERTFFDKVGPSTKCIDGPGPKLYPCQRDKEYEMIPLPNDYSPDFKRSCCCSDAPFHCTNETGKPPPDVELDCGEIIRNFTGLDLPNYLLSTAVEFSHSRFGGIEFLSKRTPLVGPTVPLPNDSSVRLKGSGVFISPVQGLYRVYCKLFSYETDVVHCNTIDRVLGSSDLFTTSWNKEFVKVWHNPHAPIALPSYMSTVHNSILRSSLGKEGAAIFAYSRPLSLAGEEGTDFNRDTVEFVNVFILFIIFVSVQPLSFCFFTIEERVNGFRRLQEVSGVSFAAYLVSNFIWDFAVFSFSMGIMFSILLVSSTRKEISQESIHNLLVVCFTYGVSMWMFIMVVSKMISDPNLAFTLLFLFSAVSIVLAVILGFIVIMNNLQSPPGHTMDENSLLSSGGNGSSRMWYEHVGLYLDPCWSYGDACLRIMLHQLLHTGFHGEMFGQNESESGSGEGSGQFWVMTKEEALAEGKPRTPRSAENNPMGVLGGQKEAWKEPLQSLWICGVMYMVLLVAIESGLLTWLGQSFVTNPNHQVDPELPLDVDVMNEKERIIKGKETLNDLLVCNELVKIFSPPTIQVIRSFLGSPMPKRMTAVNGVTFGTKRGECFGLLGVNGAGKSTLFKMVTGELWPTSGFSTVAGISITKNRSEALRKLGYCPQTEALCPLMTVREHIILFARLRGIPFWHISEVVKWGLKYMGLEKYKKLLPSKLSGGNKRKLQVTLSLIGNPELICLDEPTTGVDPRARKYVWECISGSSSLGHGVLLTTHSMEESESLCHKLTIMLAGQFVCLGSLQHIKSKFSKGYTFSIKLNNTTAEEKEVDVEKIGKFVGTNFPDATLINKNYSVLMYQAPVKSSELTGIFDKLTSGKNANLYEDFSISQTTLEQIFLVFADVPRT